MGFLRTLSAASAAGVVALACSAGDQQGPANGGNSDQPGDWSAPYASGTGGPESAPRDDGGQSSNASLGDGGSGDADGGTKIDGGSSAGAETIPLAQILADGTCSAKPGDASLSAGFANASEIAYIVPLGLMTAAHITPVDHMYIYYPSHQARTATDYPVVSPGDGYIRSVSKLDSDYRVIIEHSCDVWSIFIHVQTLTGPLASLNGQVTFQNAWGGSIAIKAGDTFATDGGQPGYDYSVHDQRVTLKGLRPASYSQAETWKLHTVDPFDYIPEPKKSLLLSKDLRSASPRGGRIDYDNIGVASGNWFVVGTNGYAGDPKNNTTGPISPTQMRGYWDTHLALAPNPIDPTHFMASIGNYDGNAVQYAIDVDPLTLTVASGATALKLYAFEYQKPDGTPFSQDANDNAAYVAGVTLKLSSQVAGVILVQAQADGTLKVEKRPGATASTSTAFGTEALVYEH